jgi:thiol-disulfide isomerase/thioredoxin
MLFPPGSRLLYNSLQIQQMHQLLGEEKYNSSGNQLYQYNETGTIANLYEIAPASVRKSFMRKLLCTLAVLSASLGCFGQKVYFEDSLLAHYDLFNNKPFTNLQLEDTSGILFNTSSLSGKTVYVDFWFTTCPPCVREIPYFRQIREYFAADTNIAFLSICIENIERKDAWKQMIKEQRMTGIQLFYARNRPQKINLLRQYQITFPTYLLLNTAMKVIGYDAPRPSERGWIEWAIVNAKNGNPLSNSYLQMKRCSPEYRAFKKANLGSSTF